LLAIGVKIMLIHQKIQARKDANAHRTQNRPTEKKRRRTSVGGVQVAPELMRVQSVHDLKEKFDEYRIERWSHILHVLVAIFECARIRVRQPDTSAAQAP
jgi:hypothetical protein